MHYYAALVCFVATFFMVATEEVPKECDKLSILIYEDLGCKPEYDGRKCPVSFKCEERKVGEDSCYLGGRKYKIGESIDYNLTSRSCLPSCFCHSRNKIVCATMDCGEFMFGTPLEEGCYRTHELGQCCSTGEKCESNELATCVYDGNAYKEGQAFLPKDRCYKCICQKGFKGVLEKPYCERTRCNVEIQNSDKIDKNCAPIYNYGRCCPSGYACPSNDEVIIRSKQDSAEKCKYGDKLLNIGDSFKKVATNDDEKEINCKCEIPPLVACY